MHTWFIDQCNQLSSLHALRTWLSHLSQYQVTGVGNTLIHKLLNEWCTLKVSQVQCCDWGAFFGTLPGTFFGTFPEVSNDVRTINCKHVHAYHHTCCLFPQQSVLCKAYTSSHLGTKPTNVRYKTALTYNSGTALCAAVRQIRFACAYY